MNIKAPNSLPSPSRVIVGMSGGVDSSVAALLLKEQGHEVEGLFMKNWTDDDTDTYCSAAEDIRDAELVCNKLGIPLHIVNFSAEYWKNVFEHCLAEYQAGRTPNPDILCNQEIKFKCFLNYAIGMGADYIATGHYSMVQNFQNSTVQHLTEHQSTVPSGAAIHAKLELRRAADRTKDQSYFLYTLSQSILSKILFPIGHLEKKTVRELAANAGFPNHQKKDSTGLCFIGERKFKEFLNRYITSSPGNIVASDGKILGKHDGLMFYTLGQRQGLGIGGLCDSSNEPWYVVGKDLQNNALIVAQGEEHPLLYGTSLLARNQHWVSGQWPASEFICTAKIRYRQQDTACLVSNFQNGSCKVTFKEPQRAITPGQSVVFYDNEVCLGGGIIQ